jgi:hypothetical protein
MVLHIHEAIRRPIAPRSIGRPTAARTRTKSKIGIPILPETKSK